MAYYFSKDEKLLVFSYNNQDSLSALLHGKIGVERTHLDWDTRLKIAVGAARGIAHIHNQDNRELVHGNIKASNIFLNKNGSGLISDVGLIKLISPFTPLRLTAGYYAPEVADSWKVSQASDVYSFGVVLLELVSGMPSQKTSEVDGESISLVKWIQLLLAVHKDWNTKVFDIELLRSEKVDTLLQLLQIGMNCAAFDAMSRPTMAQVVKMLEQIHRISYREGSSIEAELKLLPFESRLEDLLEDMLPALTL